MNNFDANRRQRTLIELFWFFISLLRLWADKQAVHFTLECDSIQIEAKEIQNAKDNVSGSQSEQRLICHKFRSYFLMDLCCRASVMPSIFPSLQLHQSQTNINYEFLAARNPLIEIPLSIEMPHSDNSIKWIMEQRARALTHRVWMQSERKNWAAHESGHHNTWNRHLYMH